MPQNVNFSRTHDLLVGQKMTRFLHPPSPFPSKQWWHLYCIAIHGLAFIVIHSVTQRLLRNRPGSNTVTSHNFLCERLQRTFIRANQLHWTTQQMYACCSCSWCVCMQVCASEVGPVLWESLVSLKGCYSVVHCYYSVDSILVSRLGESEVK